MAGRQNSRNSKGSASSVSGAVSPAPGRRERNKQEKLARIVGAARALFRDQGFTETTTQQIAEAADIGAGTLFLYARSKEDLLVMVFRDEMVETARAAFARISPDQPLIDQLLEVFGAMLDYHARDTALARILLKEAMFPGVDERRTDITELLSVIYAGLAEMITRARAAGRCNQDADPIRVAENLFANYYMDLLGWLAGLGTRDQFLARLRQHLAITISAAPLY